MNIDPIRATLAPYALLVKLGLACVLAAAMFIGGCNHGAEKWEGKYDDEVAAHKATKAEHKGVLNRLAEMTKAAAAKAKAASEQANAERAANDKRFKESEREAERAQRDLAAALRRGTVRLRDEWTCPAAGPAQGGAATPAGGQDAAADLRRAREGAVLATVADADHADRWIGWLQAELKSTRTACGVTP